MRCAISCRSWAGISALRRHPSIACARRWSRCCNWPAASRVSKPPTSAGCSTASVPPSTPSPTCPPPAASPTISKTSSRANWWIISSSSICSATSRAGGICCWRSAWCGWSAWRRPPRGRPTCAASSPSRTSARSSTTRWSFSRTPITGAGATFAASCSSRAWPGCSPRGGWRCASNPSTRRPSPCSTPARCNRTTPSTPRSASSSSRTTTTRWISRPGSGCSSCRKRHPPSPASRCSRSPRPVWSRSSPSPINSRCSSTERWI